MEIITVDGEKANARGTAQLWMSCPGPNSMIKDIPKQALSFCKLPKNLGAVLGRRWRTDYTSVAATPFEFGEDGFKKKKCWKYLQAYYMLTKILKYWDIKYIVL